MHNGQGVRKRGAQARIHVGREPGNPLWTESAVNARRRSPKPIPNRGKDGADAESHAAESDERPDLLFSGADVDE